MSFCKVLCFAECHYGEHHYAECHSTECPSRASNSVECPSVECPSTKCHGKLTCKKQIILKNQNITETRLKIIHNVLVPHKKRDHIS